MSNESTLKGSQTDWEALEKMEDEDIDLSEIPEVTAEQIAQATLRVGGKPVRGARARKRIHSSHYGRYLQIRPKAANARALGQAYDEEGNPGMTLPRGFYLRTSFTRQILEAGDSLVVNRES